MRPLLMVAASAAAWLAFVLLAGWAGRRWLARGPRGDPGTGLLWVLVRGYCRAVHRPICEGLERVPDTNEPGGLLVISNHTSPVDPLLIQAACRFEIRWMMAREMMVPALDWLWRRQRVIAVDRDGADLSPLREAIRHVKEGGVVGIFPEGGIVRPTGQVRPFHEGVGLIVARTRAPVLLVWVRQTPAATGLFRALGSPSRSRVTFVDRLDFEAAEPAAIARALRQRLTQASGWAPVDEPLAARRARGDPFALPRP